MAKDERRTITDPRVGRLDRARSTVPAIGASVPRADALEKVTGSVRFAADHFAEDMLWAGVKRAGLPHARVKSIAADEAREISGIVAVLTHEAVKGTNRQGVIQKDQQVLVDTKVRHCGDAVALVVAESTSALRQALAAIQVEYDPLPGVFDPEEALKPDAPLVHEDHPSGNLLLEADLLTGRGEAAAAECDVLIEACFETGRQEHAYLETECGWAVQDDSGKVTIVCSTQTPFRDRMEVAEALGLDPLSVRIVVPYVGGAFGGKDGVTVQTLLGLAALHSGGRPVKMVWSREESFLAGTKRHPARMYYRLGADRAGMLQYLSVRFYLDTGPYDHLGGAILVLAFEHAGGPYRIPNAVLQGYSVYTNNPIGGAFRGFGVTQVTAAMEQMMDMLGERLGMDPLALRMQNALRQGDTNCVGKTLTGSTGFVDCLEVVASHPSWRERQAWKASAAAFKRRGIGIASVMHALGYGPVVPDYANAKVELTTEGKIRVFCGVVDMGQGNAATNLQIAGALLSQPPERIELVLPDTDVTLPSGSASASRCTYTFGNALIGAAEALKDRLLGRAADLLMVRDKEDLALIPGAVKDPASGREIPLVVLARFLNPDERVVIHHFRAPTAREELPVSGQVRLHGLPHQVFSYGVHLVWVEVDELTGGVDVKRYVAVSDCGNRINPQIYEQQIHGAVAQGIGYALMEDFPVEDGVILTPDLFTYAVPTALDLPEIESIAVETYEATGPFGLKGVGEIAVNGPLPAISNAVADACGIRLFRYPLTAERVKTALDSAGLPSRPQ